MEKFCVFCGKNPQSDKNKEHIIPKWLIEFTGDPNRQINLGFDLRIEGFPLRKFSFNTFQFPSCQQCNTRYSKLEDAAKNILIKLINHGTITVSEICIFLDWLDKIRIGLWLAFHYLDGNYLGINPRFHISTRIRVSDRMIAIYETDDKIKGIQFLCTNLPIFQYQPSCFTLMINNLYFFNLSKEFLFSRRIGFPHPGEMYFVGENINDLITKCNLLRGNNRKMIPLIKREILRPCLEIYQPCFRTVLDPNPTSIQVLKDFYSNTHVKENCMDWDTGIGNIFIQNQGQIKMLSKKSCMNYNPPYIYSRDELMDKITLQTLEFQIYLLDHSISTEKLNDELKKIVKLENNFAKNVNKKILKNCKKTRQ